MKYVFFSIDFEYRNLNLSSDSLFVLCLYFQILISFTFLPVRPRFLRGFSYAG